MKNFRLQIILRVAALALTLALAAGVAAFLESYLGGGLLALVAVGQCVALVRYLDKTNRDLERMLLSIQYADFSQRFSGGGRGGSFADLAEAFREVVEDFRAARAEKEEQARYLDTVITHVGVGLISFRQDGSVSFINPAAKRLLGIPTLRHIQALRPVSSTLTETIARLRTGEKALVKLVDDDNLLQLVVYATEFRLRGEGYKLISLQNIQHELEEKEVEAWQRLTRVLTHEIMNSIAPISSLASTARGLLAGRPEAVIAGDGDDETLRDVEEAVQTIERRSEGLLSFVQAYRKLTRVPKPNFEMVPVAELFQDVADFFEPQLAGQEVDFQWEIEPDPLEVTADRDLVEQVLINLLKNAKEAVEETPGAMIRLSAHIDRGRVVMQVSDTGPGIIEEAIDQIFVPFFTTKQGGSGIGLSLSREIMRQHGGSLSVISTPGERTVFTMRF